MKFFIRRSAPPLGLLSIASYLKERGYNVRLYDRCVERISLEAVIADFRPDAAGVTMLYTQSVHDGIEVSAFLQKKRIPVVWGGGMASALPEMVLREGNADYVVFSEGEISFHELLQAIEKKGSVEHIKGIAYLDESGVLRRTPEREFADLADFPVIDWSFVDPARYFEKHLDGSRMMWVYRSKGCPGKCTFCVNKRFNHSIYRRRPTEYVTSEIRELATRYGADTFGFSDETFCVRKDDLRSFCDSLRNLKLDFTWGCLTRIGLDGGDLQYMYDSGCRWIFVGMESGSPEMLRRIHKNMDFNKIDEFFQSCREIGIRSLGSYIIGFPDETEEQLRDTVNMMLRNDASVYHMNIFTALPGTESLDYVVENGLLDPPKTLKEWGDYSLMTEIMPRYSKVPEREFYVIQSFFFWRSFFSRTSTAGRPSFDFALNLIRGTLGIIFRQNVFHVINGIFQASRRFFRVAWYNFAYPGIRKKYNLYKKNMGKTL